MPTSEEMPDTISRSPEGARRTWSKAHDSAVEQYGEGERAHRTAFAALKRTYEKVGDHWERKARTGPSDQRSSGAPPRRRGATHEGVDANASKRHLYELAKRLDVPGRSSMDKRELVEAVKRANRRAAAAARKN